MIRSSKHTLKFTNNSKLLNINILVDQYRSLVQNIIDNIWNSNYKIFSVQNNKLECPKFLDTNYLNQFNSELSARLKQCAGKQALAMLSAATELRRKQLWMLRKLQKSRLSHRALQRKIGLFPLVKPNASNINMELDSRFVDFKFTDQKEFICFVRLTSYQKGHSIKIPVKHSPVFEKWNALGNMKKSIRISKENIILYFEVKDTDKKTTGNTVGCDQGIVDVITLSDKQHTSLYQGKYSLSDIQKRLCRKQKGSKATKRTEKFRTNMINWSINQLNFSGIKELRVEKLLNVRKGRRVSKFLSHWTYTEINAKLKRVSEEKGFLYREVPNEFRSQRCLECGWVRKANRKGKTFCCTKCRNTVDADLNAASNLELDLYEVPYWVRLKRINRVGFYWRAEGLFDESQESIVPDTSLKNKIP